MSWWPHLGSIPASPIGIGPGKLCRTISAGKESPKAAEGSVYMPAGSWAGVCSRHTDWKTCKKRLLRNGPKHSEIKCSCIHSLQPPSQQDFFTKNSWSGQSKGLPVIQGDYMAPQTFTNNKHLGRFDHQNHSDLSKGIAVPPVRPPGKWQCCQPAPGLSLR